MADRDVWTIVQNALIDAGVDTYAPDTKYGDCTAPYAVLKIDGAAKAGQFSSQYRYYTLLCYVPKGKYKDLLPLAQRCEEIMAKDPIYPMLMPTGAETPPFYDNTYNAYMISIQYRNNVRNEHL
jgi:hypothetical protein